MSHFLFLTYRMALGYGVDVVIYNVTNHLKRQGHRVSVACIKSESVYQDCEVFEIAPDLQLVRDLAGHLKPTVIIHRLSLKCSLH